MFDASGTCQRPKLNCWEQPSTQPQRAEKKKQRMSRAGPSKTAIGMQHPLLEQYLCSVTGASGADQGGERSGECDERKEACLHGVSPGALAGALLAP